MRKNLRLNPSPRGIEVNGPLYYISPANYNMTTEDQAVAAMIKGYIVDVDPTGLDRVISSHITAIPLEGVPFPTVEELHIEKETWTELNGYELAKLIDAALPRGRKQIEECQTASDEKGDFKRSFSYMHELYEEGIFPYLTGKKYVESRSDELARFLTDCWLVMHRVAE